MNEVLAPQPREPIMHHDGSNSARARSARIRIAHDDEPTRLDSMRRNGAARDREHELRGSFLTRLTSPFLRAHRERLDPLHGSGVDATRELGDA